MWNTWRVRMLSLLGNKSFHWCMMGSLSKWVSNSFLSNASPCLCLTCVRSHSLLLLRQPLVHLWPTESTACACRHIYWATVPTYYSISWQIAVAYSTGAPSHLLLFIYLLRELLNVPINISGVYNELCNWYDINLYITSFFFKLLCGTVDDHYFCSFTFLSQFTKIGL